MLILITGVSFTAYGQETITLSDSDIKAYPGCIGHGCDATGPRNVEEAFFVTNTNDTGAGSLRVALTDAVTAGGGYIILRTYGTILYDGNFFIGDQTGVVGNVYLAGQTAPGGGMAIRAVDADNGPNLYLRGSNMIVRHFRFRGGDGEAMDGIKVGDNDLNYTMSNIVIDHCSFAGAFDEGVSFATKNSGEYADASALITGVSFTNNLIGANIGPQYAFIVYGDNVENMSIIGNYFSNNDQRHVLINGTDNTLEFINNYVYNWGEAFTILARGRFSAIGNVYDQGNIGDASFVTFRLNDCLSANCGVLDQNYTGSEVYLDDNLDDTNGGGIADNDGEITTYTVGSRIISSGYTPIASSAVSAYVQANAGAGVGINQGRDSFDAAQMANHVNDTGSRITTFSTPTLSSGPAYSDTDGDGLSDAYELDQGGSAVAVDPYARPASFVLSDGKVVDQSGVTSYATAGYNHMDVFLADLAGDWDGFATTGEPQTPDAYISINTGLPGSTQSAGGKTAIIVN